MNTGKSDTASLSKAGNKPVYIFITIVLCMLFTAGSNHGQQYICRNGEICFISHTPVIDIDACSVQAGSIIDFATGQVVAAVPLKSFRFKLALAEDHFNEDYVDSEQYPKSTFKGQIVNMPDKGLDVDSAIHIVIKGSLTLHGVTNPLEVDAVIQQQEKSLKGTCRFMITLSDYQIRVPATVKDKVAQIIPVEVVFIYELYK